MTRNKDLEAATEAGIMEPPSATVDFRVRLGAHVFHVHTSEGVQASGNAGFCSEDTQEIFLSHLLSESVLAETIIHECLHALWHQTGLDSIFTDEQEELVAWTMAPLLLAFVRDNWKLMKTLREMV